MEDFLMDPDLKNASSPRLKSKFRSKASYRDANTKSSKVTGSPHNSQSDTAVGKLRENLQAICVNKVDLLKPHPRLTFKYEMVNDESISKDLFANSGIQASTSIDLTADQMDAHELRAAMDREIQRHTTSAEKSLANSENVGRNLGTVDIDGNPSVTETNALLDEQNRNAWPWRDSRDLHIYDWTSNRRSFDSQSSHYYDQMLSDPGLSLPNRDVKETLHDDGQCTGSELQSRFKSSHHSTEIKQDHFKTMRNESQAAIGLKYDYKPSSGRVFSAAYVSFLKQATAERILRGQQSPGGVQSSAMPSKPITAPNAIRQSYTFEDYSEQHSSDERESFDSSFSFPVERKPRAHKDFYRSPSQKRNLNLASFDGKSDKDYDKILYDSGVNVRRTQIVRQSHTIPSIIGETLD
ncbi:hypothetical protein V1512DRAFT_268629 [Lipomyces arxii]|uniref:uncharacterized protein n=1 Tax=Lipomyces arxii TaxID=56418 RepID=UPI0034CE0C92